VRQIAARQYVLLTKASSNKQQALDKSLKLQAPSSKLQAPSRKRQACDKLSQRRYVALTQDVGVRRYVTLTQDVGVRQFGS